MAERGGRAKVRTWPVGEAAQARGFPHGLALWSSWLDRLRVWAHAEAGPGRLLAWVPVAFGAGIALYFTAEHEPIAWVATLAAFAFAAAALALRKQRVFPLAVLIAALAAGFATVSLKASRIAHPVLAQPLFGVALQGFVETREEREKTDRFVLRIAQMEAPRAAEKLTRVRLSVKKGTAPLVGSFVELKARLTPPLQPLRPGSYDFGRDLYFQGIGATGFVTGAIKPKPAPGDGGVALRYAATLQGMRDAIDARIRQTLSGDTRAIATALLTGKRDAITTPVNDAMFISGLGHVLSISGYHMAVVAGVVFFAIRALLALVPVLTVTFPIKKVAAAAALVAAAFYLLLSGAEVATQRSFLMTAVVLIAVMVDRQAITFRTLAIAALIVLIVAPEALVHPSFQMSFAATLGLVALVQIGLPSLFASPDHSATARAALWGAREIAILALASLVAGLATTPYAAFHFHRVTPYGVVANLLAMPVVSAIVMPAGLLGLLAMPFGFDGAFWRIMEVGIDWMVIVAQAVAALPGAVGRIAAFGTGPLLIASLALVVMGLLRTPLRHAGAALLAFATLWAVMTPQPDILIAADGRHAAVRGADGKLRLLQDGKDAFLAKEWLAADGDGRAVGDPSLSTGVSCDEGACVAALADGRLVSLAWRPEAVIEDCEKAAVLITRRPIPDGCAARAVDADTLRRSGAQSLRQTQGKWTVTSVRPAGRDRPWEPGARSSAEGSELQLDTVSDAKPSRAAPRPVQPSRDATPPADVESEPD